MRKGVLAKCRQYAAALLANLGVFCVGTMLGWTSPMQPLLESADSPVGGRALTRAEVSWVGSINFIGAIVGTFLWGRLSDRFGRKTTFLLIGLPFIVGWAIVLFARETAYLYVGRVIIGLGCSGAMINTPMFVTEIAQDDIRGTLGSFPAGSLNLGILFCYVVGSIASYEVLSSLCLAVPIIFMLLFTLVPDSPVYLYSTGKSEEAHKAMQWYRGGDATQAEKELASLRGRPKFTARYLSLLSSKGSTKALFIAIGFVVGYQFSGILTIQTYTVTIFKEAGSSLPPYIAAIIIGILQLTASIFSSYLVDKAGRKFLLYVSYGTMAVCLTLLVLYFRLSLPDVTPVLALSMHVIAFSFGAGLVQYIVIGEIFTPELRGTAMSLSQMLHASLSFAFVKLFPSVVLYLGQSSCFLLYGICCVLMIVFTVVCVPETKGRSLQAIVKELEGELGDEPVIVPHIRPVIATRG